MGGGVSICDGDIEWGLGLGLGLGGSYSTKGGLIKKGGYSVIYCTFLSFSYF